MNLANGLPVVVTKAFQVSGMVSNFDIELPSKLPLSLEYFDKAPYLVQFAAYGLTIVAATFSAFLSSSVVGLVTNRGFQ